MVIVSLSLPKSIVEKIDKAIEEKGFRNRSDFVRKSIEYHLSTMGWDKIEPGTYLGTVQATYKCDEIDYQKLATLKVMNKNIILAEQGLVLQSGLCVQVYTLYGSSDEIRKFLSNLNSVKGIEHIGISVRKI